MLVKYWVFNVSLSGYFQAMFSVVVKCVLLYEWGRGSESLSALKTTVILFSGNWVFFRTLIAYCSTENSSF
jgi:hypothetical protein